MGWEKDIEELRRREALARAMGGADKVMLEDQDVPMLPMQALGSLRSAA